MATYASIHLCPMQICRCDAAIIGCFKFTVGAAIDWRLQSSKALSWFRHILMVLLLSRLNLNEKAEFSGTGLILLWCKASDRFRLNWGDSEAIISDVPTAGRQMAMKPIITKAVLHGRGRGLKQGTTACCHAICVSDAMLLLSVASNSQMGLRDNENYTIGHKSMNGSW